jgi:threonine synthase
VRELFDAGRLDDEATLAAIADCRKRFGATLDPHSAIGYAVAQQHRRDPSVPMVVLATAIPPSSRRRCRRRRASGRGCRRGWPTCSDRTERVDGLPNDIDALKDLIEDRMGATPQRARARS